MKFKDYIKEETTSGDIATVDTKLNLVKKDTPKKCKKHNIENCKECTKIEEAVNKEFTAKVRELKKIETQALNAQRKMDQLRSKWEDLSDEIIDTYPEEWKQYTAKKGLSTYYTFGDLLA